MLTIDNIKGGYGGSVIIDGLSLELKKGEVVALLGKNGAGKTTFLKMLMGLISLNSGRISFNGCDISKWKPEKRALSGIGYVPQGRDIFPFLTVRENLILGLEAKGKKEKDLPEDIFVLFPELKNLAKRKGGDLSGGQQQQLAIARILVTGPKMIILDEPTEGIQPSVVNEIENALKMIKDQGDISIILVEQFMEFALRLSDKCCLMEKGNIIFEEKTENLEKERILKHLAL
jgi:urea transport system ATP-binding protein